MQIHHDFHLHTRLSLCAKPEATLDLYLEKAKKCGLDRIAITDHLWDHAVDDYLGRGGQFYEIQSFDHVRSIKEQIDAHNKTGDIKVFFGAETEYCYKHRRPAISPAVAEQLDVLLAPNSHTHLAMPPEMYEPHEKHIQFMIDAFMDIVHSDVAKYVTAIPHPFMAVCCPYGNRVLLTEISDDRFKYCFDAAAEKGIALELNPNTIAGRTEEDIREDPIFRMFRLGKECGCKFTVGTDAHGANGHDHFARIYDMIEVLGLTEEDLHPLAVGALKK